MTKDLFKSVHDTKIIKSRATNKSPVDGNTEVGNLMGELCCNDLERDFHCYLQSGLGQMNLHKCILFVSKVYAAEFVIFK